MAATGWQRLKDWVDTPTNIIASFITILGLSAGVSGGTVPLVMVAAGLGLLLGVATGAWRWPRSERARFQDMHDQIAHCRDLQVEAKLVSIPETRLAAQSAFRELRMRLLSVRVNVPDLEDSDQRVQVLDRLVGLAVDGQVMNARRLGRALRGIPID